MQKTPKLIAKSPNICQNLKLKICKRNFLHTRKTKKNPYCLTFKEIILTRNKIQLLRLKNSYVKYFRLKIKIHHQKHLYS